MGGTSVPPPFQMDKVYQDISPDGLKTTAYVEADGRMTFGYEQDAEPAFEAVLQHRNKGQGWSDGMKKGMVHALHIPNGVLMELRKVGVDVYTMPLADIVRGLKQIGRYQACDMTGKRLA